MEHNHENKKGPAFGKSYLILFAAGLAGIIALVPISVKQLQNLPGLPVMPFGMLIVLSMLQPLILLVIALAFGTWMAPRAGLTSLLMNRATRGEPIWSRLRPQLTAAILAGIVAAVLLPLLDALFQPWLPASLSQEAPPRDLVFTVSAMLYGGITEELLLRWGMMSVLAWVGWRLFQRHEERPGRSVMVIAILISAVLFGIGHLGAVAVLAPLTPVLILRTILLNAVGGIIFGWLFWKRSLEAAMIAHATAHVVMTLIAQILILFV
ncbi:CPBP family intramembrane metalloprotease [Brevibacillus ruminantium]|uniref:CPBP family intramembrane metalloprotease n=1 Tax=Brevibacillus ruminantium TaxID=2950604 RepID=A0ABY4WCC1_9BACL|nr:CPBP family intramembrane glutamic endopeptidase [Brevibacillus ruminantium]USG64486.1 CPBP family intramembrane metalloprotease [Brevibacillus ruminantium]